MRRITVALARLRVLNCSGSGSTSGIIAALNWLPTNAARPAVANMSLGGGYATISGTSMASPQVAGVAAL
jgi:subtilisin family serine protease